MGIDSWRRQLDGRVVYQHCSVFEPELRSRHFVRLAQLVRSTVVSNDVIHYLARGRPRQRALGLLIDLAHRSDRPSQISILARQCCNPEPFGSIPLIRYHSDTCTIEELPHNALAHLARENFDHFITLAVGALVIVDEHDSFLKAKLGSEGDTSAAIRSPTAPLEASELLYLGSRALMTQWWNLETDVISLSADRRAEGSAIADRFARDVVASFCSQERGEEATAVGGRIEPPTPFCRDLALAWASSGDRVKHTVGALINHVTCFDDLRRLGATDDRN